MEFYYRGVDKDEGEWGGREADRKTGCTRGPRGGT